MHFYRLLSFGAALLPAVCAFVPNPALCNGASKAVDHRSAQEVIAKLGLTPNIEGGYFVETFRDEALYGNRSVSTAIYYLLEGSTGRSRWHRLDTSEVWHYYAGAPLSLFLSFDDGTPTRESILGPDIFHGESPQVVIAPFEWQQAQSRGKWTLVGTTVAPAFTEEGFELAEPGWEPHVS